MKKTILSILALFLVFNLAAQKQVTLTIKHMLGSTPFGFSVASQNDLMHNFKISRVDYYISRIKLIHDGGMTLNVPSHYILAKGNNNVISLLGTFNITNLEGIKFSIGVESPTNTSDPSVWLPPHPLAPQSPSMHWGWSAGYRFIALEGDAGATFNTGFEMHGLGDANYFEQTIMTGGVSSGNAITINLDADYTQALKGININAGPIDHGVNATDLTVIQNFRDHVFKPGTGIPTSVTNTADDVNLTIYPNPAQDNLTIDFDRSNSQISKATLLDLNGRAMVEVDLTKESGLNVSGLAKGFYLIRFSHGNNVITTRKVTIE